MLSSGDHFLPEEWTPGIVLLTLMSTEERDALNYTNLMDGSGFRFAVHQRDVSMSMDNGTVSVNIKGAPMVRAGRV